MNKIFRHRKVLLLTMVIVGLTFLISVTSIIMLYRNAQHDIYDRLTDIVNREKIFTLSLLESDTDQNRIIDKLDDSITLGKYGEIAYARAFGHDSIEYIISSKSKVKHLRIAKSKSLGTPMQRALNNESGIIKDKDYRGVDVFAAYTYVKELKWGIVAKLPVKEVNSPYIFSGVLVLVLALVLMSIAVYLLTKFTNPIIDELKRKEGMLIEAKERAEENEAMIKAAMDNSQAGIAIAEAPSGKLKFVNNAALLVRGKSYDEIVKDVDIDSYVASWQIMHFDGTPYASNEVPLARAILYGETCSKEFIVRRNNMEDRIVWANAAPIYNKKGEQTSAIVVFLDITDQKHIEFELQYKNEEYESLNEYLTDTNNELSKAKERAEESDRLKSAFLANMSHEIRTPMNGILGFAEILREPALTQEQQQAYLGIIEKSGRRMLNIINDIVDISKIESGLMELHTSTSNVNEQAEYIYTFFKPQAKSKDIELSFKVGLPSKEAFVTTDKEKLYAILTNLVKNALKFTEEGSVEFGYRLRNGNGGTATGAIVDKEAELEFYVKDTGIGVPKDRQAAIFDRFVQADIADTRAYQGAGLGLSIAKAYVEMMGGKIWLESEEGKGSTFYFTLPFTLESKEIQPIHHIATLSDMMTKIKKLKILIAEDDETSEMLIRIAVGNQTDKIIKAYTGEEAVEACRKNPDIDLVMMDIKMAVMDGYEATRKIRQFNKDVIIIAQTAYGLAGDRDKALSSGCNDYIAKPINKTELLTLMHKYFAS